MFDDELQVTIPLSRASEATAYPWWMIVDPGKWWLGTVHGVTTMITGPFFSRQSAEDHLRARAHAFSRKARVYCASGHASREWRAAIDAAHQAERAEMVGCTPGGSQ